MRQTPFLGLVQAALEHWVQLVVQPLFKYLEGVVECGGLAGPRRQPSRWHPGQHK